jgi:uncharacterized protein
MMVVGLADAFKATGDHRYLKAALKNMEFIERELIEGVTLYRSYKGKRSHIPAFLDDYAYLIQASIRLYQVTFNEYWIKRAELLMVHTIDHFLDSGDGFFLYSGKYGEKLIADKKEIFDNVIPASNSVMAQNLLHLGVMLDREEWKTLAENMTLSLGHIITTEPNYMSNWAIVYTEIKKGLAEVSLIGPEIESLNERFHQSFQPFALTMGTTTHSDLPLLEGKVVVNDQTTIYVCFNKTCQRPVTSVGEALEQLKDKE